MKAAGAFVSWVGVLIGLIAAIPASADTAKRYPHLTVKAFVRAVGDRLTVVDTSRNVHTQTWTVAQCLRATASRWDNSALNPRLLQAKGRIRLTAEMEEFFDGCLADEGYAFSPDK